MSQMHSQYAHQLVEDIVQGRKFRALLDIPLVAWQEVGIIVTTYTVVIGGAYFGSQGDLPYWLVLIASSLAIYAVFTPLHDATHRSVSRNPVLNDLLGTAAAQPLLPGFTVGIYRYLHLEHHRHTGDPEKDPDERMVSAPMPWRFLAIMFIEVHWLVWYWKSISQRNGWALARDFTSIVVSISWQAAWLLSPYAWEFFIYFMIPQRLGVLITGYFFASIQHPEEVTESEYPLHATRMFKGGLLSRVVMISQSQHLMHHLFPRVPYYRYNAAWELSRESLEPEGLIWDSPMGAMSPPVLPTRQDLIQVMVESIEPVSSEANAYVFAVADGSDLPQFFAGAHIDVHIAKGLIRQYSLTGMADEGKYSIAVKKELEGRGGSVAMHEQIKQDDVISISWPRNLFKLDRQAEKVVLVAGGIGITPMIAMAKTCMEQETPVDLIVAARSQDCLPFSKLLASPKWNAITQTFLADNWVGAEDLPTWEAGMQMYLCGPAGFMDAVTKAGGQRGWPVECIHTENFSASPQAESNTSFSVTLAKSKKTFQVLPEQSLLNALQEQQIPIEASCEQGLCGTCVCEVLDGEVDHRDSILTPQQKAEKVMTACVSRAKGEHLTLNL